MGREIKRVPENFDHPLGERWHGFVNPYYAECPDCKSGGTASLEALERLVRILLVAAEDSLCRPKDWEPPMKTWGRHEIVVAESRETEINGRIRNYPHPYVCDADIADPGDILWQVAEGLTGKKPGNIGYCSSDVWLAENKILEAAGLPEDWGFCPTCKGAGQDPEKKEDYEAWKETPVPEGPWWQLWETVSEGSPISPAFATPEELIDFMSQPAADSKEGWAQGYCREVAEKFVKGPGWAPSGIMINGQMVDGVTGVVQGK